ncbi:unnamed protein product [Toxocara canis]|uniref:Tetraspanin n=1 Tax=Toxocara canis TaxID=6265 RepID=A0A183V9F1_TOXCA|nr:unnamed protein product [Toxocara canis]
MSSKTGEDEDSEISPCVKYTVFILSGFFFLISMFLLAVGLWGNIEKGGIVTQLNKAKIAEDIVLFDPTVVLIIVGGAMFIIDFFGWAGALRENVLFLLIYHTSIGIVILAELGLVVLVGVGQHFIAAIVETKLNDTIINYRDDLDMRDFVDWSQTTLECCGIWSADDWNENVYFSDDPALKMYGSPEAGGVPFSCCINKTISGVTNMACGHNSRLVKRKGLSGYNIYPNIYQKGCIKGLKIAILKYVLIIAPVLTAIIVIEVCDPILFYRPTSSRICSCNALT